MNQNNFRSALFATAVQVGCHLFLWLAFVAVMIFYVPSRKMIFDDLKLKVADMTITIFVIVQFDHRVLVYLDALSYPNPFNC